MISKTALQRAAWLLLVPLFTACSGSGEPAPPTAPTTVIDPSQTGSITVQVRLDGPAPPPRTISMTTTPACAAAHSGPVYDQSLVLYDGRLQNAVVWIEKGMEEMVFAPPRQPLEIDQKGCLYTPHVSAAMVGQPIEFANSDREAHNVHSHPDVAAAWNFMLGRQGATRTLTIGKQEIGIRIGCDIHPWMVAYVSVFPHPYFAITDAEGTASIPNVPAGSYTVAVWHERLGTARQPVTIQPGEKVSLRFAYGPDDLTPRR